MIGREKAQKAQIKTYGKLEFQRECTESGTDSFPVDAVSFYQVVS